MTRNWKDLYRPKKAGDENAFYSETALDHFANPRNVGRIDDFDGWGRCGDPSCGDYLEITLTIDENARHIERIAFQVRGCAGAIATSSATTELALGRSLREALRLTDDDVVRALDGLPEDKKHCSLLGIRALRLAIADALKARQMIEDREVADAAEYRELRRAGRIVFADEAAWSTAS